VLASDQSTFDVAAKFTISMNGIWIRDTASIKNDTLFVAFTGQLDNSSWSDTASLGDHDNTGRSGIPPQVLPVGPFTMIPGSGKSIAFGAVIANAGHTSSEDDAKKALEIVSHVGAVTATTILSIIFPFGAAVWAGLSAAADELNQAIIDWALADCDTVVLNDGLLVSEQDLFIFTFDPNDNISLVNPPNWILLEQKKKGDNISTDRDGVAWLGGGCRDSNYSTNFSLQRLRVPEMVHDYSADGILLGASQEINFGLVSLDPNIRTVFDPVEGDGGLQPNGLYEAPSAPSDQKFNIIKWTVYQETPKGIITLWRDFSIVLLD
jgi:hypothetical protein